MGENKLITITPYAKYALKIDFRAWYYYAHCTCLVHVDGMTCDCIRFHRWPIAVVFCGLKYLVQLRQPIFNFRTVCCHQGSIGFTLHGVLLLWWGSSSLAVAYFNHNHERQSLNFHCNCTDKSQRLIIIPSDLLYTDSNYTKENTQE